MSEQVSTYIGEDTRHGNGGHSESRRTWVTGLAIGAEIVARDIVDEVLQDLLVARLLALVERAVHGSRSGVAHGRESKQIVGPKSIEANDGERAWLVSGRARGGGTIAGRRQVKVREVSKNEVCARDQVGLLEAGGWCWGSGIGGVAVRLDDVAQAGLAGSSSRAAGLGMTSKWSGPSTAL